MGLAATANASFVFTATDITEFDNETFANLFERHVALCIADAANTTIDYVWINNIIPGSVVVDLTAGWTYRALEDGARPPDFVYRATTVPETIFEDDEVLDTLPVEAGIAASMAVKGVMRRPRANQVIGQLVGLASQACVNTMGTRFAWTAEVAGKGALVLSDAINKASTAKLYFPENTLQAHSEYRVELSAWLAGNKDVKASAALTFEVGQEPLRLLVAGGGSEMGSGSTLRLDASMSSDPNDDHPSGLTFSWRCVAGLERAPCYDGLGIALPKVMSAHESSSTDAKRVCQQGSGMPTSCTVLATTLRGAPGGLRYTFTCSATKGNLSSSENVHVVVHEGPQTATVHIVPRDPPTAISNAATVLRAAVACQGPAEPCRGVRWEADTVEGTTTALDLATAASTPLSQPWLALRAGFLMPGATYRFTLCASVDTEVTAACASLTLSVNRPPRHAASDGTAPVILRPSDGLGNQLTANEAERRLQDDGITRGVALEDYFTAEISGWEDEPNDLPLMYKASYQVTGQPWVRGLMDYTPATALTFLLPEAGLAAHSFNVTISISVRDMLGALSTTSSTVCITGHVFESWQAEVMYMDSVLSRANQLLIDGSLEVPLAMVSGVGAMMNAGSSEQLAD
eukprot:gene22042-26554_t